MTDSGNAQAEVQGSDDLAEGYPSVRKVLYAIGKDPELPTTGIRRLEVNTFASGDATYRMWTVDSEEPQGGYLESV